MADVLTPERVVELAVAYYQAGYAVPGYGTWFQWRPDGPPLACIAMAAFLSVGGTCMPGAENPQDKVFDWVVSNGMDLEVLQGLTLGFDGDPSRLSDSEQYRHANAVGMAARAELAPVRIPQGY